MAGDLTISWGNLDNLFTSMQEIRNQGASIDAYFSSEVCSTAGFDYDYCVLKPISDQLVKVGGVFSDLRGVFEERWDGTVGAMITSAKQVDATDNSVSFSFERYRGDVYGPFVPQQVPQGVQIDVEAFPLEEVKPHLKAPGEGSKTIPHNKEWESITDGFDALRDTINSGIDKINSLGVVSVDRLTEKSLDEFVVYPLSGNYLKIQGNAEACDNVDNAMTEWSGNFSRISGKSLAAMGGDVGASLVAHLELYHLVMRGVGEIVGLGSKVFDAIAKMSEKIAVSVENALVTMAKILLRVSTKIVSRVLSYFGWLLLAKDIVTKGTAAITDIVDDVKLCIEIIQACFALKDAIEEWAESCAEQLEAFEEMVTLVSQLPQAREGGGLGGLPPIDPGTFETDLADITYDFGDSAASEQSVDEELDDLEEDYPDDLADDGGSSGGSGGDDFDLDDDEILMAPGPLGVPGGSSSTLPMA
ncbi:MAG: hypothetical protein OSB43_02290 [Nocardioides sp.]|uniref:hypothetical protein n=1 Tax=Nocardioides sp. TaxID=35761 RepID=UPI000C8C41DA|nr:hypothetical protein [Nocardioides sp.]MAS55514.1 hypothetical protein [Pimelobacter sp.]MDE0775091.1 hypothetical protein [Nocardioides sp.]